MNTISNNTLKTWGVGQNQSTAASAEEKNPGISTQDSMVKSTGLLDKIDNFYHKMKFKAKLPKDGSIQNEVNSHLADKAMVYDKTGPIVRNAMTKMRGLDQSEKDVDPREGFVEIPKIVGYTKDPETGDLKEKLYNETLAYDNKTEKPIEYHGVDGRGIAQTFETRQGEKGEFYLYSTEWGSYTTQASDRTVHIINNNTGVILV